MRYLSQMISKVKCCPTSDAQAVAESAPDASRRRLLAAPLLCLVGAPQGNAQPLPTVAAAADLKFALEELSQRFHRATGTRIALVFGSSGNIHMQILQGAPFELFLSADEALVFKLHDAGLAIDRGRVYAVGRIGLLVPKGSPLKADGELKDLAAALIDGRLQKLAMANPEHAPYGNRAMEALQHAGLWDAIRPKLVLGENVAQAAQFALSGATQGGIVALSLARASAIASRGSFALIASAWHRPLVQRMVLIKGASAPVRAFHDYLASPDASFVMRQFGFELPAR